MRTFKADEELEKILLNEGLFETTSDANKTKGRKSFKLGKRSLKEICFNNINIEILNGIHGQDSRIYINETELRLVLLFLKLPPHEVRELLNSDGTFKLEDASFYFNNMKDEIAELTASNLYLRRRNKLKRIMKAYNAIEFNKNKN
jgi:hypothetical protein